MKNIWKMILVWGMGITMAACSFQGDSPKEDAQHQPHRVVCGPGKRVFSPGGAGGGDCAAAGRGR